MDNEHENNDKRGHFGEGFASGVLAVLMCLLAVIVITQWMGVIDWRGLLFSHSGSVINEENTRKLSEIQAYIDNNYLEEVDEEQMEKSLCQGAISGLNDPYAAYYDQTDYEDMKEKTAGNYYGIGAYVSQNPTTGAITITAPIPGSPAEKAGIRAGDVVSHIDGKSIEGMDLSAVVSKMKGKEGTKVTFTVVREGLTKPLEFTVTREEIESQTVSHEMLDDKIGYIRVTSFEDVTKKQFRDALSDLEKKGEKRLIIDLRNNGGGLLTTAVDMLDRLLPDGVVVYTMDKKGKKKEYTSDNKESFDKPAAILVNGNSASASEVFSGAMQDYKKAVLVGTKTFGKGIVQSVYDLSDGTALKLTTSKYYTPDGRNIHGTGLEPDIEVEMTDEAFELKNGRRIDNQVQEAVEYLKKK